MGLFRRPVPVGSGFPNLDGVKIADALTAAGFRVDHKDADQMRRLIQPWQARAFAYYDLLGELWYAAQFYARMMSLLRLYPAELDDNGDWVETTAEPAVAALERIQDPGGGREALLTAYGRLMFIAGESYLLCSIDPETGLEQWEMLSTDELRIQSGVYTRYRAPSMAAENLHEPSDDDFEPLGDTAIAYRLWRRHPRYSMLADSPMKGVLDLAEELLLLTRAVRARARSRPASAGILAISEDFSHAPRETVPDEDIELDPFLRDLRDAMLAPIGNEGSPSAVVPLVVRGTTNAVEKGIRHIQIVDPTQLYPETGLRYECIKRMAIGLDLPPEILLGLADSNHWTGWLVDETTWKAHGQPASNQLVNDLTSAYFRPQLREDGVQDWERYAIAYDASAIVNHPDRATDAQKLYDRRAIGKQALRDAAGFDEEDAPDDDELNEMIGVAVRDGSLALFGIPSVKAGGIETEPGELVSADGTAQGQVGPTTGAEVEPGPAKSNGAVDNESLTGAARIAGAADLAMLRAREVAGSRLRSLAKRDPEAQKLIDGVPNRTVAARLGAEMVKRLGEDERALVARARGVLEDALRMWGLDEETAALLVDQVERHAARTLYDENPSPLPPQFRSYVAGVLARS
jgi:hypothetical protein